MRVEIISKNYRTEDGLKELLTKKLSRLDKYFQQDGSAAVKLSIIGGDQFQMEIALDVGGGKFIRAAAVTTEKMNENIDVIMPKLERQIVKNRAKSDNKLKKDSGAIQPEYIPADDKPHKAKVVKEKRFNVSVCTAENAVEEMEMLSHDFYVFINAQTNRVNVVYKRNDGDFGLIDPEYED